MPEVRKDRYLSLVFLILEDSVILAAHEALNQEAVGHGTL